MSERIIEFNGRRMSLKEWADELGMSSPALLWRLDNWGKEKALTTPARTLKTVTIGDETRTLREWADIAGITYDALWLRLRDGVPEDKLLDPPRHARTVTWGGKTLTVAEWAERIGITESTLYQRLKEWPLRDAMTRPVLENPGGRGHQITFRGETKTLMAWAEDLGITHQSLRYRLDNWTLERALTAPPQY